MFWFGKRGKLLTTKLLSCRIFESDVDTVRLCGFVLYAKGALQGLVGIFGHIGVGRRGNEMQTCKLLVGNGG